MKTYKPSSSRFYETAANALKRPCGTVCTVRCPYGSRRGNCKTTGICSAENGSVCTSDRNGVFVERMLCAQSEAEEHPGAARCVSGGASVPPHTGNLQQIHAGKRRGAQCLCTAEICPRFGKVRPGRNVFQAGKVFAHGGLHPDLLTIYPRDAKRGERLRTAGS